MSDLHKRIMAADISAINGTLADHGISAVVPARTMAEAKRNSMIALSSHCAYRVRFAPGVPFSKLEKVQRELASAVSIVRHRAGFDPELSVRLGFHPFPTIEIDSPVDHPLALPPFNDLQLPEFCGALGVSFGFRGKHAESLDLASDHQTMISALSGHGKSTVARAALTSMLWATSPERLRVILIDLKNDDLVPYIKAPHTLRFAGNLDEAIAAIAQATAIKEQRIAATEAGEYRLLIVIDELAELDDGKNEKQPASVRAKLASLMQTGRSLGINVIAATQYPTSAQIGVKVARAATHKIVGRVDSSTSANFAAGRKQTGAEMLRKKGSFLRIGTDTVRTQTYHSTLEETAARVADIRRRWHAAMPATVAITEAVSVQGVADDAEVDAVDPVAELAEQLGAYIAEVEAETGKAPSKRSMARDVLNRTYGGSIADRITAALAILESATTDTATTADIAI